MASSDADVAARTAPLEADDPRQLGSYRLLGQLGKGGMGKVYLGRSSRGRLVAIKVIRTEAVGNPEFRARFRLEAETARRVARVCTAEVLDADPDAEWPYIVTEFIEGETLSRYVQRNGPLADANLEQLAVGVAAALTAIHSAGIIHRDLKPANVILSPFGPRVIDFGIARTADEGSGLTGDLQQLGTPAFMSPEQIESRPITSAVDVWAWGGLVAFAATGHYPFGAGSAQVLLYRALHEDPRLDDVDPALRPIVWLAMRKDPAGRPTAQQLMLRLLGDPSSSNPDAVAAVNPEDVTNVLQGWQMPTPGPGGTAGVSGAAGVTGPTSYAGAPHTGSSSGGSSGRGAGPGTGTASGYTAGPDDPTRLPNSGTGAGAGGGGGGGGGLGYVGGSGYAGGPGYSASGAGTASASGGSPGGTVGGQSPTRVGSSDPGIAPGGPGHGPGGPGSAPGELGSPPPGRGKRPTRTPLLVGGAVVLVGAIIATVLALNSGGKDDTTSTATGGSSAKPTAAATSALPESAQPLGADRIVFTAKKNGNYDLFTAAVPTGTGEVSGQTQITSDPGNEILPVIRPDRKTVVYFVKGSDGRNRYTAIAADGKGKPVPLFTVGEAANLTIPDDSRPSFSADGGSLVTRSTTNAAGNAMPGLYLVNLRTSKVTRIEKAARQATDPALSPSGDTIVYWANQSGGTRGFIVTIGVEAGAQPARLTEGQGNGDSDPVWSPDGSKIIFTRATPAGSTDLELFEMNSDGNGVTQLTHGGGQNQDPAFAPQGDNRIVYSAERPAAGGTGTDKQLRVLNPQNPADSDHPITTGGDLPAHARWNSG
ncbi:eukaryotic-like serine/threonine-protein kinase [Frankia sp. AiPs1]|uniref:protein kinase domain-containing protein n=1 Tax=Frankia sp. AiPa1 TaxID=573492 RepID=UPI00202B2014|nr:protein kinase [Frankia sp. AiPa1]MCL9761042.1 serine/threonine-protein kinase [Frankia sp. AiPa1]